MRNSTVRAVNRLTARWAAASPLGDGTHTVFTAAGVWPLLALLADGAAGPAREELAEALGIPARDAAGAARELLAALGGVRGLRAATGVWARADLPLEETWSARLPPGTRGTLTGDAETDRKALDGWAAEHTDGLVERMPVALPPGPGAVLLVLACALALRLKWIQPFQDFCGSAAEGPWQGRDLLMLGRTTSLLDRVRVAHGPAGAVTVLDMIGDTGVDVHLVLGEPGARPAAVIGTGIGVVDRTVPATDARSLPEGSPGPGLLVGRVLSDRPETQLRVVTPAFEVRAEHDLLARPGVFGLTSALDTGHGHFPGISPRPLAVGSARQAALARFHARGFEAAAVTAIGAVGGCAMPRPRYRVRRAEVSFHRPFAFLAVHRVSRLVLASGWVAEPLPYPEHQEYEGYEDHEDYDEAY
ncbi:serpin family protein [Streptomyces sp. NPDC006512]|uniref:serpin family protein n=1 Tax=Streptomyces sp. NPDC006512 TaxID=3154307 RepID=UPI0033B540AD